jgi:hypothetical protein
MADAIAADDKALPKSPSKIYAGLLWQPKRKSHEDAANGPVLAKSRRTGTFDEATAPPSQTPARPIGVPEFRIPDLHPKRPLLPKYPSSQISPRDDSKRDINHHLGDPFEKANGETVVTKDLTLRRPLRKQGRAAKSREYLPTEARRINTPPVIKPGKGNRLMGQFWDNWTPGVEGPGPAADFSRQEMHIPFPMPPEFTVSAPTTPMPVQQRDDDWYRIRADQILGHSQPRDLEELKTMVDWDVPDHLPSSPLCPANPKHTSGGTGVCVYHGRAKCEVI